MYLDVDGGRLAYEVTGSGPLVVLAHGIGDSRAAYRFVAPALAEAGYRVAAVDLRGTGESSATWPEYSRTAIAGDLLALVRHLGGPAVLVGHSISGGAVTIAAATEPGLVTALVQVAPFTRAQSFRFADLFHGPYRRGVWNLAGAMLGRLSAWRRYLEHAYPGPRPADWSSRLDRIEAMLREPGRTAALQQMLRTSPADAGEHLAGVRCPVLVIEGSLDPDWVDPGAEGAAIVAALPDGLGRVEIIEGAGHYPHVQFPEQVVAAVRTHLAAIGG
ncbi:alpha/beta fold hydrolase [Pseudonocardia sp. HH130630-07]|uniref:alpha/beta fold hydrolase n=1 Tax=Pseudonocardia sp. HH130630-07 TaxID=1690815 RepID=UPI000814FE97|nr:alpha/beta hydrolase [Pseudonocardia sp. HH130630-07]ANY08014.1 alpha/beta hydrolase [Pseudonocardia sp. HH130630-07]